MPGTTPSNVTAYQADNVAFSCHQPKASRGNKRRENKTETVKLIGCVRIPFNLFMDERFDLSLDVELGQFESEFLTVSIRQLATIPTILHASQSPINANTDGGPFHFCSERSRSVAVDQ